MLANTTLHLYDSAKSFHKWQKNFDFDCKLLSLENKVKLCNTMVVNKLCTYNTLGAFLYTAPSIPEHCEHDMHQSLINIINLYWVLNPIEGEHNVHLLTSTNLVSVKMWRHGIKVSLRM